MITRWEDLVGKKIVGIDNKSRCDGIFMYFDDGTSAFICESAMGGVRLETEGLVEIVEQT